MKSMKSMIAPTATLVLALGSTGCALEDFEDVHDSTKMAKEAAAADVKMRSVQIFTANSYGSSDRDRIWSPDGGRVVLNDDRGGYFADAYEAAQDIDMSGVMSEPGVGSTRFIIQDGGDPAGREMVETLRQGHVEVITMYREYKQEEGIWENKKTVTIWGYIASANLSAGASSLSIEVHTIRVITQNDTIGTRDYSIDAITGVSTLDGGTLGNREPTPINPPEPRPSGWGALLNQ